MSKYNDLINKIEVSEDMRSRILANVAASVKDAEIPEEVENPQQLKKPVYRTILHIAAPVAALAAVAVIAFIIGSRLFGSKGRTGGSGAVAYDAAVTAAGSGSEAGMLNGKEVAMEAAAEDMMEEAAPEAAEPEETRAAAAQETHALSDTSQNALTSSGSQKENEIMTGTVFYTNHHIPLTGAAYPSVTLVTSRAQLEAEFMTDSDDPIETQEYLSEMECSVFDEEYFKTKDVLVILAEESSGSISHRLTSIDRTDENSPWTVHIEREVPDMMTADMAYWYIVAEVDKGVLENAELDISLE